MQDASNEAYYIVELNIMTHHIFKLTNYQEALKKADILVFLVGHKEFKNIEIFKDKVVLDCCGVKLS